MAERFSWYDPASSFPGHEPEGDHRLLAAKGIPAKSMTIRPPGSFQGLVRRLISADSLE